MRNETVKQAKEEDQEFSFRHFLIIAVLISLFWAGSGWAIWSYFSPSNKQGVFGDMFGAINALFSGLAFVGVIFAILLQRQELRLQREELEATREELKGQKEQLKAQNETMRKQNFEATFFQVVSLLVQSTETIRGSHGGREVAGRTAFQGLWIEFKEKCEKNQSGAGAPQRIENVLNHYEEFYSLREWIFGHHFRILNNLFNLVETADVNERQGYANLFRDQLSKFELTLFFYHYLSKPGRKQKYLVEKYQMLTNLDFHWLIQYGHKDAYQPAAFGVRDDA